MMIETKERRKIFPHPIAHWLMCTCWLKRTWLMDAISEHARRRAIISGARELKENGKTDRKQDAHETRRHTHAHCH
jgi:hypothetical protein